MADAGSGGAQAEAPRFCGRCGASLHPGSVFCAACGAGVRRDQVVEAMTTPRPRRSGGIPFLLVASILAVALLVAGAVAFAMYGNSPKGATPAAARQSTSSVTTNRVVSPAPTVTSPTSQSPTSASLSDLYKNVNSGVVRIETSTCDGGSIGTGFLVAPDLVATVAHVVEGAGSMSLTAGDNGSGGRTSGVVVGVDPRVDVALIRTSRPIEGHVFTIADTDPGVGQQVGAIGFPEAEPMTLTTGIVSGLDRTILIDGTPRVGLIQTDAAINPGNSGGPMLTTDGQVYGLIDAVMTQAAGIAYAVSPRVATARLTSWKHKKASVVSASCDLPVAPQPALDQDGIAPPRSDARTLSVAAVFDAYFTAINTADYDSAWSLLSPRLRGPSSAALAKGDATSFDTGVSLRSVSFPASDTARAHVSFTSFQAPEQGPDGDTCDLWDLDYTLTRSGGAWLIDRVRGHAGGPTHERC